MQEEEIDLIKLFNLLKKSAIYRGMINGIYFIFSNNLWFVLFLVLGGATGYYFESKIIPIYSSEMTINSRALNNTTCEQVLTSLSNIINERNQEELKKVGIPIEISSAIQNIMFVYPYPITDSDTKFDSLRKFEPFKIVVSSPEKNKFSEIELYIINYLKNNNYSLANQNRKTNMLEKQKAELQAEIEAIDSLQIDIIAYLFSKKLNNYSTMIDPSALIRERTKAKLGLIEIEKELSNIDNFEVLNNMIPRLSPDPTNDKSIPKYGVLFFIVGGILLRLIKKNKSSYSS